jgi:hypothetical protein
MLYKVHDFTSSIKKNNTVKRNISEMTTHTKEKKKQKNDYSRRQKHYSGEILLELSYYKQYIIKYTTIN